jgi:hypothetical protein
LLKRWLHTAFFVSLAASSFCLGMAFHRQPEGTLVVEPPFVDAGVVTPEQQLTTEFRIRNRFPVPVSIHDVMKDCDCTEARVEARRLEPGAETRLVMTWSPGQRRGATLLNLALLYEPLGDRYEPELLEIPVRAQVIPAESEESSGQQSALVIK